MSDLQEKLSELQVELAEFRGRTEEKLTKVADKNDVTELKLLIEQRLQVHMPIKYRIGIFSAVLTAVTSIIVALLS